MSKIVELRCTFVEVDFWSRCLIKTEKGTILCDIDCHSPADIKANPNIGDWHTVIGPEHEPCSRVINIHITLVEQCA